VICVSTHSATANAKQPGSTYCFNDVCHRVMTIAEVQARLWKEERVEASFYDACEVDPGNPCGPTSSGEVFNPERADNAASPIYPNGTRVLVTNPKTGRGLLLRINNSGPYYGNRIDVSRAAAEQLGFSYGGVTVLTLRPISVSR
jgi:rare lipoprotein A